MKVKELMEKLKEANPDTEVIIRRLFVEYDGGAYTDDVIIDDFINITNDGFIIDITSEG